MEMTWNQLLSTRRLCSGGAENRKPALKVHPYDEDQDLIIFSQPFRRMQAKTQVHPLSENDHVRTRLTHSLEVGMVGYVLGYKVAERLASTIGRSPHEVGALVRAACLAHDIGNPPFGHTGEDAIRDWARAILSDSDRLGVKGQMSESEQHDIVSFDGNAQGFRILTQTENYRWKGGLRLTCSCLGTFMKYPWSSADSGTKRGKFGFFESERSYAEEVAAEVGLLSIESGTWCRHPLVWLVEAADDLCYAFVDLEDGIEMGSYTFQEYEDLFRVVLDQNEYWKNTYRDTVVPTCDNALKTSYIRSKLITLLVSQVVDLFCCNVDEILAGSFSGELLSHTQDGSLVASAKEQARQRVFKHSKKLFVEVAAYEIIGGLLEAFGDACFPSKRVKTKKQQHLRDLMGVCLPDESCSAYLRLRRVIDFVSGMTDRFALGMYRQIRGIVTETMTPAPTVQ